MEVKQMQKWLKIIKGLQQLVERLGPIWPSSTRLSGYAEDGPYHCEDCPWLRGRTTGRVFKDSSNKGRCHHPVVLADKQVRKDVEGFAVVNIEHGCCEFVEHV